MAARAYRSFKIRKNPDQISVHAPWKQVLCKWIACKIEFTPKRKGQVFCSSNCRLKYFKIARSLGVMLLEKSKSSPMLKVIVDRFLREGMGEAEN